MQGVCIGLRPPAVEKIKGRNSHVQPEECNLRTCIFSVLVDHNRKPMACSKIED